MAVASAYARTNETNELHDSKWSQLILRAGFLTTGALLMNMAFRSWQQGETSSRHTIIWLVFIEYALAFGLLAISVMSLSRMKQFAPLIAGSILFAFLVWSYINIEIAFTIYGTDNAALSHVAAERLLDGENPYSINDRTVIDAAADRFGVPQTFVTSTTDGQSLSNLMSWPAGSVLVLIPPLALGLNDVRWVVVAFQVVAFALLWFRAPPVLRPLAALPLIIDPDLFVQFTGGGVMDYIWVTPMLASAIALYRRRLGWAALFYGLAAGIKQQPWLLAPFLLIWIWQTATDEPWERRATEVVTFAAISAVGFLSLNLPFMLWSFPDWVRGTMLPLHETLIPFGSGISLLTQADVVDLPKSFYSAATFGVWFVLALAYWLHFRTLRHALWLAPALVMWFGYRGMQNYFVFWIPMLLVGLIVWWEEMQSEDSGEELWEGSS